MRAQAAALRRFYQAAEEQRGQPFPSGESLGIKIPERCLLDLQTQGEFAAYLEHPEQVPAGAEIIRINFAGDFGSALVLPEMIPEDLIGLALAKIESYIETRNNKEYFCFKLLPIFKGREPFVRGMLNRLGEQPGLCRSGLLEGEESSYVFWAFFCNILKDDIRSRSALLSEDIAAMQGAWIIETANHCFKAMAAERQRKENAFKELLRLLNRPPYRYTIEDILRFTGAGGQPLLGVYTGDDLAEYLRRETTESRDSKLPALLLIQAPGGAQYLVSKTRILLLCYKLLLEAADKVKEDVLSRWEALFRDYRREPAMEDEEAFAGLLRLCAEKESPLLAAILGDRRFLSVCLELGETRELAPAASRFFARGELLPLPAVFKLKRKDLLEELRSRLPLRYTLPLVSGLLGFLFRLLRKAGLLAGREGGG